MEERPQARKGHFWIGLSVGLLIGILFACAFYFLDKYTSLEMLRFQRTNTESAADTVVQIVESPSPSKKVPAKKDTPADEATEPDPADTTAITDAGEMEEFDTDDLMMDIEPDNVKNVVKTTGIASRRVRVINETAGTPPNYEFFDVEQWSEPVKNRISYQRNGNTLKIRGISIIAIEIEWNGEKYLLRYNGRSYSIPENQEFTRLTD